MHAVEIYLLISESKKILFELAKTIHFVLNFDRQLVNVLNFVYRNHLSNSFIEKESLMTVS